MNAPAVLCPRCQTPNQPGAYQCYRCGAPLQAAPAYPPPQYPPQPPQPYPYPYSYPPQPQAKKGVGTCGILGIIGGIGACLVLVILIVVGAINFQKIRALFQPPSAILVQGTNSITLTSGQEGKVSTSSGAELYIPSGAVPLKDDGTAGTMVFSISEDGSRTASPPGGYQAIGSVYQLGPEGFTFNLPVMLSLPIPPGVDPSSVGGATYFDPQSGEWKIVPATIDPSGRKAIVAATHFSGWGLYGNASWEDSIRGTHGKMVVRRPGSGTVYTGTPTHHLPKARSWYGVCVVSWTPDNPGIASWFTGPADWKLTAASASPGSSIPGNDASYWFPAGSYQLVQFYGESELNNDPLTVPYYFTAWSTLGNYNLAAGQTIEFAMPNDADVSTWSQTRPPCWGAVTTSVGTGAIQVTLTWQADVDLDLYVKDPYGETIYFGHTEAASGGTLDRDNLCSNMEIGRPENIFWTDNPPSGQYIVEVEYYGTCVDSGPIAWNVRVVANGEVKNYSGTVVNVKDRASVTTFTVP